MRQLRSVFTTLLAAVVPATGLAQTRGGVEGRVIDAAGRPLAAADVSVGRWRATTDADGAWRIAPLEPGPYRVVVRRLGYRPLLRDVDVEAGRTSRLIVSLELVPFTLDSLVVSAPPSTISTTDAELSTKLTVSEIALLPSTFDPRQLIALTAGARPDQIWGGASDQANSYSLDGTTVNHPGLGGALLLPSPSWIETLEVRGLGAGADVGSAQGGLVEVVTLAGRNVIEGALRTSFESQRLNGTNLVPGEIGRELASRREVDGQVRGPLVRDRLHFAAFGHVIRQEEQVLNYLPSTPGAFVAQPPSFREERGLAKLTWKPSSRDLLEGSLMGRYQDGDHVGQTGYEAADATERLRQSNLTGNLTWQRSWSPRSALAVRVGGFTAREWHDPYRAFVTPGIELLTEVDPPQYQSAVFRTGAAPSSLGLTAAWTGRGRLAGLEHEVKVGVAYVHRRNRNMVALVDRNLASNYTVVQNVIMLDRFGLPVIFAGRPLVVERLAISNEDILYVQELLRQGQLTDPNVLYVPPGMTPAQLASLRYDPDFVLTKIPEATRRFGQLQLRLDARYRTWWAGASATLSTLKGNYNVVTGPDDYTNGGPGPWVRLNEQYNFFGALNNQSRFEGKVYLGGLLPARFRGGVFFSYASGDRVTPTLPIDGLLSEFAVAVPSISTPGALDTVPFHRFLFRSETGHRIFIQPRGTYGYEPRASLDLHLERSFPRGGTEVLLVVDGFNVLGDRSVTGIQTAVNALAGFTGSDYGRVRSRVPPRTLRLGAGVRF